jgi:signal transduction histidine kinase
VSASTWSSLATTVSQQLIGLATDQASGTAAQGATESGDALTAAWWLIGLTIGSLLAVAIVAWRLAGRLARRVRHLAADAATLDLEVAPGIVDRLRNGEDIDDDEIAAAVALRHDGRDEIGTLAARLVASHINALHVTRTLTLAQRGWTNVLVGYARRIQAPIEEQFAILVKLQSQTEDQDALTELYGLDKLATSIRRFLTGLFVLTGQGVPLPREAMSLEHVVTTAVHQTSRPAWFRNEGSPRDLSLKPRAAVLAVQLLTELAENAVAVSSAESPARIRATKTAHGVAIEVEDLGHGLSDAEIARFNSMMDDPPLLADMAMHTGSAHERGTARSVLRLGLFTVAAYAKQGGMRVRFSEGSWQGARVVVTVPDEAVVVSAVPASPAAPAAPAAPRSSVAVAPVSPTRTALRPAATVATLEATEPVTEAPATATAAPLTAESAPPLPQRVRGATLVGAQAPPTRSAARARPTAAEGQDPPRLSPLPPMATSIGQLATFTQHFQRERPEADITNRSDDPAQNESARPKTVEPSWPAPDDE